MGKRKRILSSALFVDDNVRLIFWEGASCHGTRKDVGHDQALLGHEGDHRQVGEHDSIREVMQTHGVPQW